MAGAVANVSKQLEQVSAALAVCLRSFTLKIEFTVACAFNLLF